MPQAPLQLDHLNMPARDPEGLARWYAQTFGLQDRGVVKEGAFADLTLFDPGTVGEAATFARPIAPARGIEAVVVNGALVWRDGKPTGARPGRAVGRVAPS